MSESNALDIDRFPEKPLTERPIIKKTLVKTLYLEKALEKDKPPLSTQGKGGAEDT